MWEGYDVGKVDFKQVVTVTYIKGSIMEFCMNLTEVVSIVTSAKVNGLGNNTFLPALKTQVYK